MRSLCADCRCAPSADRASLSTNTSDHTIGVNREDNRLAMRRHADTRTRRKQHESARTVGLNEQRLHLGRYGRKFETREPALEQQRNEQRRARLRCVASAAWDVSRYANRCTPPTPRCARERVRVRNRIGGGARKRSFWPNDDRPATAADRRRQTVRAARRPCRRAPCLLETAQAFATLRRVSDINDGGTRREIDEARVQNDDHRRRDFVGPSSLKRTAKQASATGGNGTSGFDRLIAQSK